MRSGWLPSSVIVVAVMIISFSVPIRANAQVDTGLQGLRAATIIVEDLDSDAQSMGITTQMLLDQVLVALKSKAPRLKYDTTAEPYLYINVNMLALGGYSFAANVQLNLVRPVEVLIGEDHIGQASTRHASDLATVWTRGYILTGPRGEASTQVSEALDKLLVTFFADYYRTNP